MTKSAKHCKTNFKVWKKFSIKYYLFDKTTLKCLIASNYFVFVIITIAYVTVYVTAVIVSRKNIGHTSSNHWWVYVLCLRKN